MRIRSSRSLGFTLLEQVIIVAVLGILAASVAPNFIRMMNRAKLNQAIAEIQSALNETQSAALRGNQVCELLLNLIEGEIEGTCLVSGHREISKDLAIATNLMQASSLTSIPPHTIAGDSSFKTAVPASGWALMADSVISDLGRHPQLFRRENPTQIAFLNQEKHHSAPTQAGINFRVISHQTSGKAVKYKFILADKKTDEDEQPAPPPLPPTTPPSPPSGVEVPIQFGSLGNPKFEIESNTSVPTDPSAKIVLYLPDNPTIPKKCVAISNSLGLIRIGRYEGPTTPADITDTGTCKAEHWQEQ